jgi:putative hydrolase of the HAD superfamily
MIRTILFDLDDTLYPRHLGIMDEIRTMILRYLQTRLNLPRDEADARRREYFEAYGTTMRGLQINHQIDTDEFLRYVHDIPLHEYLKPNPRLDAMLTSIPHDKVVFTNASREHAERVLDLLAIRHHFGRIVDVRDLEYESKPQPVAYQRVCELLGTKPEECLLVEDNARNLIAARELGMVTVLLQDGTGATGEGADFVISEIEELGTVLARIPLECGGKNPESV